VKNLNKIAAFIIATALFVGVLSYVRYSGFVQTQEALAEQSVGHASAEITLVVSELKRTSWLNKM
jgi:hypothetical protein